MRNPYQVLGVETQSTPEQIKAAYRRLAREFHPDVHADKKLAEDRFKEITAAYDILSNEEKRARYDRFGTVDEGHPGQDPFGGAGGIGDIFDMFFGSVGQVNNTRSDGRNGEDLRYDLTLVLKDVLKDNEREINYQRPIKCSGCNGIGTEDGKPPEKCSACNGQGVVTQVQNSFLGQMRVQTPCSQCRGKGTIIRKKCTQCSGQRLTLENATCKVKVPAGIDDGITLHYPGLGGQGIGKGRSGDLYVVINVENDPRFEREGADLYTQIDISFPTAVLGGNVQVEGIEEPVELKIPSGTASQAVLKLSHLGLPILHRQNRGDFYVQVNIKVPQKVTDAQRQLLLDFAKLSDEDVSILNQKEEGSILGSFFKKKK